MATIIIELTISLSHNSIIPLFHKNSRLLLILLTLCFLLIVPILYINISQPFFCINLCIILLFLCIFYIKVFFDKSEEYSNLSIYTSVVAMCFIIYIIICYIFNGDLSLKISTLLGLFLKFILDFLSIFLFLFLNQLAILQTFCYLELTPMGFTEVLSIIIFSFFLFWWYLLLIDAIKLSAFLYFLTFFGLNSAIFRSSFYIFPIIIILFIIFIIYIFIILLFIL